MPNQQQTNMIQNSPIYHKTVSSSFEKLQKAASQGKFRVKSFRVKTTDNDLEEHLTTKLGLPMIFPNQSTNKMISSSLLVKLKQTTNFDIDIAKTRANSFKILQKNYEQQLNLMGLPTTFLQKLFEIKSEESETKCSEQRYQVFIKSLYIRIKNNKILSISQMNMGPKALSFFFKWFITWQGHISQLDLSYPSEYLKQHKIQIIKKLLQQDNKLIGLILCNSGLNGNQIENILKIITKKQLLIKLDLSNNTSQTLNRFGEEINILEDFLQNNQSVSTLKLNNLQLRKQGFQFICKGISQRNITPLQVLSISNNYISGLKISQSFYTLLRSGLTHLNISCNPLGMDFYKSLPNLRGTTIKQLDLRQTNMISECLYQFLERIEESKSLTVLRLDGNDFSHHWFAKMGQKLSTNTSLEWISLNNCQIKTFIPVFQGLQFNKYLKRFDANENSVNCETQLLKKIGDCFLQNKNLEQFRIKFCGLNQENLIKIFEGVSKNKKLKIIDISQNLFDDNGARSILKMLDENFIIEHIGIEKLQISYQMRKLIESKLRENKQIRDKLQFKHLKQLNVELKSKDHYTQEDIQHYEMEEKTLSKTLKKLQQKVKQLQTFLKKKKEKVIELVKKCKEEQNDMEKNTQQKIRFQNERISVIDRENRKLDQIALKYKEQKEQEMDMIRTLQEKIRIENQHIKKRENELEDSLRDHIYNVKKKKACRSESLPGVLFKK